MQRPLTFNARRSFHKKWNIPYKEPALISDAENLKKQAETSFKGLKAPYR